MSRFRMRATSIVLIAVVTLLCVPSIAFAGVSEYQVQFAPVGLSGRMDLIVNVILSPDTKLPATVRVPLPAGATVLWSGEILGGDPADDPSREATLTAIGGAQYAEFTLEKVRVAQVEAELNPAVVNGTKVEGALDWVNVTDAGTYTFSVRIEPGIRDLEISPAAEGSPQTNADGETLYTLAPVRLEKDGKFSIDVSYRRGAATTSSISPLLYVALGLLAVTLVALVIVLLKQRQVPAAAVSGTPRSDRSAGSASAVAEPAPEEAADSEDDDAFTWE
ncbi:MAG: hypothetical protein CVT59_09365 [Actinobacteria bacterium HGW-Actinobacteria-1]|nr:MAG: hypothetical protein CVT59_09365 [Actinobacteria bacterium HGW-Actinobacteria-1]